MCQICNSWRDGSMTSGDAVKAIGEVYTTTAMDKEQRKHLSDLVEEIINKDVPPPTEDQELDDWWPEELDEDEE